MLTKTRIKNLLLIAFGQSKMFKKAIPAILHLMIYAGFVINLEVLEIILDGLLESIEYLQKWECPIIMSLSL